MQEEQWGSWGGAKGTVHPGQYPFRGGIFTIEDIIQKNFEDITAKIQKRSAVK